MERDEDQVTGKVIQGDFGGNGPRQVVGAAMMDVEYFRDVIIIVTTIDGRTLMYSSDLTPEQLALLSAKLSGYSLTVANGWGEPEE